MINRINIEHFKSIKKLDLELRSLNILIGANGAGKSNFIGFFELLKNIYEGRLSLYTADELGADNILYFGSKQSDYLSGKIEFDNRNGYEFKLLRDQSDSFYFEYENVYFKKGGYTKPYDEDTPSKGLKESKIKELRTAVASYVRGYLESFKIFHFHDTGKTSKIKQASLVSDNSFFRGDGSNLAAYLYFLQEKHPSNLKRIEMAVRSVAPFFYGFNLNPDRINPDTIRLEWKERGSDSYFNAKHLSDGTLRFIALATLLLQPTSPKVIIIDEPELGLHPFAISKLAGLIKKSSAVSQIIISTQSTSLIDSFEAEDIIIVDRKDNQSVFTRHSSEELKYWLESYSISEIWNKNVIGGRP